MVYCQYMSSLHCMYYTPYTAHHTVYMHMNTYKINACTHHTLQRVGKNAKKVVETDEWRKDSVEERLVYSLMKVCM